MRPRSPRWSPWPRSTLRIPPLPEQRIDEPIRPAPASPGSVRSARRLLRRKDRTESGRFLAEGRQAVAEGLTRPGRVLDVIVALESVATHQDLLRTAYAAGVGVSTASDRDFATLTDTVTPQGVLAVCRALDVDPAEALTGSPQLVVLCAQVRDPGNLGTVIRCADAFGADAVLVSEDSVDLYNPKSVRATTGSLFHLPIAVGVDVAATIAQARAAGLQVLGADGAGSETVLDLGVRGDLARPTLWMLGNEAWGLPPEHAALVDRLVSVPIFGRAESLNLSTAAAVLLYASATAQRATPQRPG